MQSPLADRLRPRTLAEVCGQQHLLGPGRVFRKAIESGRVPNMIFYGPSGVGKTTVARIIAENSGMRLHKLNGTSAGTGDIKAVMAEIGTFQSRNGLLLYLDEIQYLNKKQQQSLLECMEDGTVTLIASTTENPYFYIYNALLSRATVFEFKPLTPEDVRRGLCISWRSWTACALKRSRRRWTRWRRPAAATCARRWAAWSLPWRAPPGRTAQSG